MKRLREDDCAEEDYSNAYEDDAVASLSKKQKQKLKQKQKKAAAELEQLPKGVMVYTQDTIPWDLQKYALDDITQSIFELTDSIDTGRNATPSSRSSTKMSG